MEKEKLEMEEREKEKERQIQTERLEMDERIQKEKLEQAEKERQNNLKMKELEMQDKVKNPLDLGTHFDVTKHIRLFPPFQKKEVDKYFLHFEKAAENLKWSKEHWTLLPQSVVIGKVHEINISYLLNRAQTMTN